MSVIDPSRGDAQCPAPGLPLSGVTLLLVEDDVALRRILRRDLTRGGLTVHVAASGAEAFELLGHLQVDVVLTDLLLGDATGLEVIELAQRKLPLSRSILMSGQASAKDVEQALALGAAGVLTKPFALDVLTDAIRHALEGAG